MVPSSPTRVVLNVRYVSGDIDISSEAFAAKLMVEMKQCNVREVMAIDARGGIVRYINSA